MGLFSNWDPLGERSNDGLGGRFYPSSLHSMIFGPIEELPDAMRCLRDPEFRLRAATPSSGTTLLISIIAHENTHWTQIATSSLDILLRAARFRAIRSTEPFLHLTSAFRQTSSVLEALLPLDADGIPRIDITSGEDSDRASATLWLSLLFADCLDRSGRSTSSVAHEALPAIQALSRAEDPLTSRMARFVLNQLNQVDPIRHSVDGHLWTMESFSARNLRESHALIQQLAAVPSHMREQLGGSVDALVDRISHPINDFDGGAFRAFFNWIKNDETSVNYRSQIETLSVLLVCAINPTKKEIRDCISSDESSFLQNWIRFHPYARFEALLTAVRETGAMSEAEVASGNYAQFRTSLLRNAGLDIADSASHFDMLEIFGVSKPLVRRGYEALDDFLESVQLARDKINTVAVAAVISPHSARVELDPDLEGSMSLLRWPPFTALTDHDGKTLGKLPFFNSALFNNSEALLKSMFRLRAVEAIALGRDPMSLPDFHDGRASRVLYQSALDDLVTDWRR